MWQPEAGEDGAPCHGSTAGRGMHQGTPTRGDLQQISPEHLAAVIHGVRCPFLEGFKMLWHGRVRPAQPSPGSSRSPEPRLGVQLIKSTLNDRFALQSELKPGQTNYRAWAWQGRETGQGSKAASRRFPALQGAQGDRDSPARGHPRPSGHHPSAPKPPHHQDHP